MARRRSPQPHGAIAATPESSLDRVRPAREADAEAIAAIHNEGIAERVATFETRPTEAGRVEELITHWILCLVHEGAGGVDGFAKVGSW